MVEFGFDEDASHMRCEGCGEEIPAFLDGCPYCDDGEDGDESETWPCPACGALIHPDAQKCSACGDWVTPRLAPSRQTRIWRWVLVIIAIVLILALLL